MEDHIGKTIKVFFDDGIKITPRTGMYKGKDEYFFYVDNEAIPLSKIIRWEVME